MNNNDRWYYAIDGKSEGPFSQEMLKSMFSSGLLSSDTLLWKEGLNSWVPYGQSDLALTRKSEPVNIISDSNAAVPKADYGLFLIIIPVIAGLLILFWIGNMVLLEMPLSKLEMIVIMTTIITAILIALEAGKNGMITDRTKGSYSPMAWFFLVIFLYIIAYPAYMKKRESIGLKNLLWSSIGSMSFYIISLIIMYSAISHKMNELRQLLN